MSAPPPRHIVDRIAAIIEREYVFAEAGATAAAAVREQAAESDPGALAAALTATLQATTRDRHLQVRRNEKPTPPSDGDQWNDGAFLAAYWAEEDYYKQGFSKAERLPGNIGLLVIHSLDEPEGTGPMVEAALMFLARCSALVIDLRDSNGGAPSGVAFLTSHFMDGPPRKLLDLVDGDGNIHSQTWTTGYLRAPRFLDKPLYVLTSARTPSATEELAYGLQALGRAVVVGEATVGAANPIALRALDEHFTLRLPTLRVVHAATGGNWEGQGVQPDRTYKAEDALNVAVADAAERVLAAASEPLPARVISELDKARTAATLGATT